MTGFAGFVVGFTSDSVGNGSPTFVITQDEPASAGVEVPPPSGLHWQPLRMNVSGDVKTRNKSIGPMYFMAFNPGIVRHTAVANEGVASLGVTVRGATASSGVPLDSVRTP